LDLNNRIVPILQQQQQQQQQQKQNQLLKAKAHLDHNQNV
jgi:hypothetical protein